ncbi:MAG: hypothetical protein ACR2OU_02695 [Thermomicrobiales bacterium]
MVRLGTSFRREIQRRIGRELFRNWRKDPHQRHSTEWDIEALTRRIGISQQQFMENAYILCDLGYAIQARHLENSLKNGNLDLTSPKGVAWANAGFPLIGVDGTPVVNVTVNVTLQQVIQEVEGLRISQEDKERIEQLFRQFEGETKR